MFVVDKTRLEKLMKAGGVFLKAKVSRGIKPFSHESHHWARTGGHKEMSSVLADQ